MEFSSGLSGGLTGTGASAFEEVPGAPIRVILAESDAPSCRVIRSVVNDEPSLALEHIDHTALISSLQVNPPDIVILDVHTPAIRRAESWESLGIPSPAATILTSYYACPISPFAERATDLLVKPFDADRFQSALDLAKSRIIGPRVEGRTRAKVAHSAQPRQFLHRLAIETGEKIVLVRTADIEWMQSSGNQIRIHVGDTSHLLRQSMKKLHALLDPSRFIRVHRNAMVNLDHVEEFQLPLAGNMFVKLRSGLCLPLRRSSRPALRKMLLVTNSPIGFTQSTF
jgi:two-component system LytT family response regulator